MRRASLSISTNAIVVLIVAVIMLGLILGLVTQGFGAVERRFLDEISNEPEPSNPSSSSPITLSSSTKTAEPGARAGFKVKIRNIDATTVDENGPVSPIQPTIMCVQDIDGGEFAIDVDGFDMDPEYRDVINEYGVNDMSLLRERVNSDVPLPDGESFEEYVEFNGVTEFIYDFYVSDSASAGTYLCKVAAIADENNDGSTYYITSMKAAQFRLVIEG